MSSDSLIVSNYCACFIDLLGQKDALKGQSVMPDLNDEKKKTEFQSMVMKSVGAITRLQHHADFFRRASDEARSEEHTSELQSRPHLVCRLLLEKKKKK